MRELRSLRVRVIETIDENGEVKRKGECLLMVWPPPLYETNTCSQYVKKGTFTGKPQPAARVRRSSGGGPRPAPTRRAAPPHPVFATRGAARHER